MNVVQKGGDVPTCPASPMVVHRQARPLQPAIRVFRGLDHFAALRSAVCRYADGAAGCPLPERLSASGLKSDSPIGLYDLVGFDALPDCAQAYFCTAIAKPHLARNRSHQTTCMLVASPMAGPS